MGLYDEIQKDISSAFDGDLADTVKVITIRVETVTGYNAALGAPSSTFASYETRGVVTESESEKDSDASMSEGSIDVLILDSEKTVDSFEMEMNVIVEGTTYEINGISVDAAGATHILTCRPKDGG